MAISSVAWAFAATMMASPMALKPPRVVVVCSPAPSWVEAEAQKLTGQLGAHQPVTSEHDDRLLAAKLGLNQEPRNDSHAIPIGRALGAPYVPVCDSYAPIASKYEKKGLKLRVLDTRTSRVVWTQRYDLADLKSTDMKVLNAVAEIGMHTSVHRNLKHPIKPPDHVLSTASSSELKSKNEAGLRPSAHCAKTARPSLGTLAVTIQAGPTMGWRRARLNDPTTQRGIAQWGTSPGLGQTLAGLRLRITLRLSRVTLELCGRGLFGSMQRFRAESFTKPSARLLAGDMRVGWQILPNAYRLGLVLTFGAAAERLPVDDGPFVGLVYFSPTLGAAAWMQLNEFDFRRWRLRPTIAARLEYLGPTWVGLEATRAGRPDYIHGVTAAVSPGLSTGAWHFGLGIKVTQRSGSFDGGSSLYLPHTYSALNLQDLTLETSLTGARRW